VVETNILMFFRSWPQSCKCSIQ